MSRINGALAAAATLALAGIPMFAVVGAAQAAPVAVQVADLDLNTPQGAAAFEQRVDAAARRFCRDARVTGARTQREGCIEAVRAEVKDKLAAQAVRQTQVAAR